jgi:hypothetical protein
MSDDEAFNVKQWLAKRGRNEPDVKLTKPRQVAVWTKTSARDGSQFMFGDSSGETKALAGPSCISEMQPEQARSDMSHWHQHIAPHQ